ncbi:MAG: gamma-D-glutamyl-meso-diaminopimelate peptidase [Clostridia bacterium]|nr:gamma-D-glutamyl-meso-diaminopimelate peptidase [Clostridia bacterium]
MKKTQIQLSAPFDYDEMMQCLHTLSEEFPFLELRYLGLSIADRAIPLLKLGKGEKRILYVGAHHGMEWITSAVLCTFLREICQGICDGMRISRISVVELLKAHCLYVVPMLNPDGVEYQIHGIAPENPLYTRVLEMNDGSEDLGHWQANARGVDLNHNYDAGFAEYKALEAASGILGGAPTRYSGEFPESEPEVKLLCDMIRFLSPWKGVLTLHTQGEEIFVPSPQSTHSKITAKRLSELTGYRLNRADGMAAFGGLSDWCAQKQGIPAFTMECGRGRNPLPKNSLFSIYAAVRTSLFLFPTLL